jgi:transposase, IS30 family
VKSHGNRYSVDVRFGFVDLVCAGLGPRKAARLCGASATSGERWWAHSGGMKLKDARLDGGGLADPAPNGGDREGRFLTLADRAVIQVGVRQRMSFAWIGREIGRPTSTITREVARNISADGRYFASAAHARAHQRRHRPKPFKLVVNPVLCRRIETWMDDGWSPKLIARALACEPGSAQTGRVSHETIYQALYVQSRGQLRADLSKKLSLKRRKRVPAGRDRRASSPYKDAFKISERPAEVADRAVPGHWEGDLIVGPASRSAIGTLVERSTRFTILLHLPGAHTADEVAEAMIREMKTLPDHLRRSITWDRGSELADYERIQLALDTKLFFCDPHSPWQRGTNENTNRLLRFWFAKGTDLSVHSAEDLKIVAAKLNRRPRPTLDFQTPAHRLNQLLNPAA